MLRAVGHDTEFVGGSELAAGIYAVGKGIEFFLWIPAQYLDKGCGGRNFKKMLLYGR